MDIKPQPDSLDSRSQSDSRRVSHTDSHSHTDSSTQVSRRAPSLAEMSVKLRDAVKADMPTLRASTVAREVSHSISRVEQSDDL